ncbi:hypothetical protein LTS16_021150 [Friedmanniomyces endolithicus]|nr:hypothetical protein LTS16_021150 [Friedmanniomyces endolithicus]
MPTLWSLLSPETQEIVLAATSESTESHPLEVQTLDGPGGKPTNTCVVRSDNCIVETGTSGTDSTTTPGGECHSSDDDDDATLRQAPAPTPP